VRDRAHADQLLAASIDDKGLRQFVLQNLQPPATPGAQWTLRCNIQALQRAMPDFATFPFDPSASRFEAPALFVSGSLSKYLTAEHRPRVREFFPAAQFDQVEGAGMRVSLTVLHRFAHALRNHIVFCAFCVCFSHPGHWLHAEKPDEFFPKVAAFLNS
jgi:pimeloyl-ACP methyl ester carboxylesterase